VRTDFARPYDWFDNPPDEHSEDFRNVIAWLKEHGAPEPKVLFLIPVPVPDGQRYPGPIMYLDFGSGPQGLMDASLVLNEPGVVLSMLGLVRPGLLTLYEPPSAPPPPPPLPPGQPANPVGVFWYKARNGAEIYQCADGDTLPDGSRFRSPDGAEYLKSKIETPFGFAQYWEKIR
jgi:hypothetical protein